MNHHTVGPWEWEQDKNGWGRESLMPAVITGTVEGLITVTDEDARLIAAAPDLLEALEALINAPVCKVENKPLWRNARIAIAKATGKGEA